MDFVVDPDPDLDLDLDPEPPLGNFQNLKLEHSNQWVRWSTVWQKFKHKTVYCQKKDPKRTPPTYRRHPIIIIIIIILKKGFFVPLN
jgi:hypothetical protein